MTTTSHALTGAAIAAVVKKPWLAIPLAVLSHFICDMIPHFGIGMQFGTSAMYWWLVIDGIMACGFAGFLLWKKVQRPHLLAAAGFAAMAPDLAWLYYGIKEHLAQQAIAFDPVTEFHKSIQWYEQPLGLLVEFLWIGLMLVIILRLNHEGHQDTAASQA